ncbi:DUF3488 and transglutaminase-like domain-containing protein [Roseateles amylovorans]|uniref:DUF3488 and transglutaminase-like domain-containing protein n=1 Tax=Roseateles amylovorans TaxID=2978473 RepID=A0ABY6B4D6_9BURK|nr:DUF3488 and transglutaminase-like domain-containing protein [Roseateles amylovorans]UXH80114.1 DUF3488 and transglutaminase-like domain-containing protein [Roseateles amylovorans]
MSRTGLLGGALPAGRSPLPREARDTLFLLAIITATLVPHAGHLPWWCSAVTLAVLAWRARLAWRSEALPGRWSLITVLAVVMALTWLSHRTLIGREAGITMLAMLMALKTLELRARRDAFVVFFLGFFLVLTQFLYSQSLLVAIWTLLCVWALLSALVLAQMPQGVPSLKLAARIAARNTLYGLPVMLALFVLFPRLPPLWGLPKDAGARTGLSDTMDFGTFAEVSSDETIAMRLRFDGRLPPQSQLYFRAQVLSRFDGRTWHASRGYWQARQGDVDLSGPTYRYEATLEPLRVTVLPMLDFSPAPAGDRMDAGGMMLQRGAQGQWIAPRPVTERLRWRQEAWPLARWGLMETVAQSQVDLALPPTLNPRASALGAQLRQQFQSTEGDARATAISDALLRQIRQNGYSYTLSPGVYGEFTPHLIDEFWFDRKLGFCEHFAAAYVVLMRAAGVPARVVTGFQGADLDLQDGDMIVRMAQAHAWAEYWTASRGWQRVDPTAAIAPERVQGRRLTVPPGAIAQAFDSVSPGLLGRLRSGWELINNRWQQRVLNFSGGEQLEFLKRLGFQDPDWGVLVQLTGMLMVGVGLIGAGVAAWHRHPHDPWSRQRARVRRALDRLGLQTTDQDTPRLWATQLQARFGDAAAPLVQALLHLESLRYRQDRPVATSQWLRDFLAQCAALAKQQTQSPARA